MPGRPEVQWIEINDFTPGVITNTELQAAAVSGFGNIGPVPGAKMGQAQEAIGCVALPNGGLAPLPGLDLNPVAPPASTYQDDANTLPIVNGFFSTGPISLGLLGQPADSILTGVEWISTDHTLRKWYLMETVIQYDGSYDYNIALTSEGSAANEGDFPYYDTMTGGLTMTYVPTTTGVTPVWLLCYWFLAAGNTNPIYVGYPFQFMYPSPYAISGVFQWTNPANNYPAYGITHESRLVLIQKNHFNWAGSTYVHNANEIFNYSDPPLSISLGTQNESFVPENPTGIQAWGSISSSELFCVKANGGGFVLSGDLNTPTITRLPGVQSTYGLSSRVAQTPIGLVYISGDHGAWLWNGGNTSQKLSNNLDDNFYQVTLPLDGVFDGWAADVCTWGDWIVFSNDWLYDIQTGGWWQLSPGAAGPHLWYQSGGDGTRLFAAPGVPTAEVMFEIYDRRYPNKEYEWVSYPIRMPNTSKDRQYLLQGVIIRAQGYGTIDVTVSTGTQVNPTSFNVDNNDTPQIMRANIGQAGGGPAVTESFQISLTAIGATSGPKNGAPAPIIYSVAVGYIEAAALVPGTPTS